MPALDARLERDLAGFTDDVADALGDALVNLTVYGSAAGEDWIPGRSDVNAVIVVRAVSATLLDVLAQVVPRWRRHGFALPLVIDEEFLDRARDAFPMEFDDMRRAHRTLHGPDLFGAVTIDRAHLRRQCEHEARARLLRLRALYLDAAGRAQEVERLLVSSSVTFLVILRHVLHLRGDETPHAFVDVLAAGERLLGPLPALRRILEHRRSGGRLLRGQLAAEFGRYLADAERIVAAVDTVHA